MGPLKGIKIVEFAGIGPAPFCCMLLSDMGAEIIRIDRYSSASNASNARLQINGRNRRSLALDLKSPEGLSVARKLVSESDVLIEGFRPGVMERLGLGPADLDSVNPRLIYGRMTGWGQDGPYAQSAGHDINFIAATGVLHSIGNKDSAPVPPLNLVADFGGGALYLALGVVCALLERNNSGRGQVVDAAMVDGSASLMTSVFSAIARNEWSNARGNNFLDGSTPWYAVYETQDAKFISIGAIEPQFYREFLDRLDLNEKDLPSRNDKSRWPELRSKLEEKFLSRTRDEWCSIFEGSDACFSAVLDPLEALDHKHLDARRVFISREGIVQPSPAPRFSRTVSTIRRPPPLPGEHTREILLELGYSESEFVRLSSESIVRQI